MVFFGIVVSFIMFSIIVILHEYGHYKTAKIFGIHVEEFGLGIPPRAKKLWKNKEGTLFSLNWIPLGGFVKIAGESEIYLEYYDKKGRKLGKKALEKSLKDTSEIYNKNSSLISLAERKYLKERYKHSGRNFYEKNIFQKTLVLLAGVIMNFFFAAIIFSFLFFIGVKPAGINSFIETDLHSRIIPTLEDAMKEGVLIESTGVLLFPVEDSIAQNAGIIQGDILQTIDGVVFTDIEEIITYIGEKKDKSISLGIKREEKNIDINISPNAEGKIGTYLSPNIQQNKDFKYKYSLLDSIKYGFQETYIQTRLTFSGLGMLVKNIFFPKIPEDRTEALEQVAGPVGIVSLITGSLAGGISLILILSALISINLGVFNLLPIPALDGGRILLLWIRTSIDSIIGKSSLSSKIENMTHVFFFLVLIALSILIAYNDIIKIIFE